MYVHLPANIDKDKPLPMVVVLHGCLQCANSVSKQTGWSKLGDENNFYVLYPQQRGFNNPFLIKFKATHRVIKSSLLRI